MRHLRLWVNPRLISSNQQTHLQLWVNSLEIRKWFNIPLSDNPKSIEQGSKPMWLMLKRDYIFQYHPILSNIIQCVYIYIYIKVS